MFFWEDDGPHVRLLVDGVKVQESALQRDIDGNETFVRVFDGPPPLEGDVVTAIGGTQRMTVLNSALGNSWEGIHDSVLCAWTNGEGEQQTEVYRPSSLQVVERALKAGIRT